MKGRVAILAIMELGDLQTIGVNADGNFYSRNPRYNGIG